MSILDLLKEKSVEEKENFLNKVSIIPLDYNKGDKGL